VLRLTPNFRAISVIRYAGSSSRAASIRAGVITVGLPPRAPVAGARGSPGFSAVITMSGNPAVRKPDPGLSGSSAPWPT
jgi:hypothetical protein